MKSRLISGVIIAFAAVTLGIHAESLTDPYEIMDRNFEALGGLEQLKSLKSSYAEGHLTIVGTGLEGTFKEWQKLPDKKRTEADLNIFSVVDGDNGKTAWEVDPNGKLKIIKDEDSRKRREIARLMNLYEYADPQSKYFNVTFRGISKVDSFECYTLAIMNSINSDSLFQYIDTSEFLTRKSVSYQDGQGSESVMSDYRKVDGTLVPFRTTTTNYVNHMVQETDIANMKFNVEINDSIFNPPAEDVKDFEFTKGDRAENIPFQFEGNHIFLEVNIGCHRSLWILDTGAGMTVIDSSFAERLGLSLEANITGQGAGSLVQVYFVSLPPFEVPGISFGEQKAVAIDMADIQKKSELKFDGILGYDFLSRLITRIDFANELISFYDPDSFEYAGGGVVVDAPVKDQTFVVPAAVNDKYRGKWSLDTGASSSSFHYPFAHDNGLLDRKGIEFLGTGAGGTFVDKISRFDSFELAGFVIDRPVIDITMSGEAGAFQQEDVIGNLGNSIMRNFVLYCDYKNQSVIFEKGDNFGMEFPFDKSGIQLMEGEEGGFEVYNVAAGTPGEKGGVKAGDIITAVNGIAAANLDGLRGIRGIFRGEEGKQLVLTVMRDGKEKELKLKLKRYI
jgi:predicted aspartyl protease